MSHHNEQETAEFECIDEQELAEIAGGATVQRLAVVGARDVAYRNIAIKQPQGWSPYASYIRVSEAVTDSVALNQQVLRQANTLLLAR